jgi:hypothetical protein
MFSLLVSLLIIVVNYNFKPIINNLQIKSQIDVTLFNDKIDDIMTNFEFINTYDRHDVINKMKVLKRKIINVKLIRLISNVKFVLLLVTKVSAYLLPIIIYHEINIAPEELVLLTAMNAIFIGSINGLFEHLLERKKFEKIGYLGNDIFYDYKLFDVHGESSNGQHQVIGVNGSGKTTMLNNLSGLYGESKDGVCYINSATVTMDKGMKMSSGERQLANYLFVMNANNIE